MKDASPADLTAVQEENADIAAGMQLTFDYAALLKGHTVRDEYVRRDIGRNFCRPISRHGLRNGGGLYYNKKLEKHVRR